MSDATIGDGVRMVYKFDWADGLTRTSDEFGDFEEAGLEATLEDVIEVAREDPDCEVTVEFLDR